MNNSEIRSRAWQIYKTNITPLIIISLAMALLNILNSKTENSVLSMALSIIGSVISAGFCYFLIRTWTDGTANISNIAVPYRQPAYRKKIIPIMIVEAGIVLLSAVPVLLLVFANLNDPFFFIMNGVIILLLFLLVLVAAIAVSLVWYIFVVEPDLKVFAIFKKSASYMARHWGGFVWFGITVMIVPIIITALLAEAIDQSLLTLLLVPAQAYIDLARGGYVYERILMAEQAKENTAVISEETIVETVLPPAEEIPAETGAETPENTEENITE